MRKILLFICVAFCFLVSKAQYNPSSCCTVSNKPYGIAQSGPTDGRSEYFDAGAFAFRKFSSRSEALFYLNLSKYREGYTPVYIDSAGQTWEFWFRNGTTDGD